jgi:hypothetical protein
MPITPETIGLDPALYEAAIKYLFDRPVPDKSKGEEEWYWDWDAPIIQASPLEWVRIQTLLFERCGADLARFSDDQIGTGLNMLTSHYIHPLEIPFKVRDPSVPLRDAMQMMGALPKLWSDCFGPRLIHVDESIYTGHSAPLNNVCYMWFDVWPAFRFENEVSEWKDALWAVFDNLLSVDCREVQASALHGIGHNGRYLDRQTVIDARIAEFCRGVDPADEELHGYAEYARLGQVQ